MKYHRFSALGVRRTFLVLLSLGLLAPAALRAQQPNLPDNKSGFPLALPGQGTNLGNAVFSQPVAADLGLSPGFKSIVFGLRNGKLYVIYRNPANGVWGVAPGWPVQLPSHIAASPAVGDVTGDGVAEIAIGYGSTLQGAPPNTAPGGFRVYRANGTLLWQKITEDRVEGVDGQPDPVVGAAIGDVDGDGDNDVVFAGFDYNLYLVDGPTGANLPGWPKFLRDTVFSTPALHDIDGDGKKDVILGVDAHVESSFNTPDGGCLRVFRHDASGTGAGSPGVPASPIIDIVGFPKCVDQVIISSPAVGDIDGDGRPEIVHGTGSFWPNRSQKIYGWHCDGSPVWGTAQNPGLAVTGQVITNPALADITGDGVLDVLFTTDNTPPATDFRLHAVRGNGSDIFPPVAPRSFFGTNPNAGDPIVADVLGDTALEILVPVNTEIAAFTTAGVQLTETTPHPNPIVKPSFYTASSVSGVVVTDLETNGAGSQTEVILVSATPAATEFDPGARDTQVNVWNPITRIGAMPWPMFHHNSLRTGVAPGTTACPAHGPCTISGVARNFFTLSPCRILDTRNANSPFGGPALSSGPLRDHSVFGVCGIPNTARALSANVTVVGPTGSGFVRFSPGCQAPVATVVNFSTNQVRGNNAVLSISDTGILSANAFVGGNGTVHLIVDVNGYYQ